MTGTKIKAAQKVTMTCSFKSVPLLVADEQLCPQ